MIIVVLIAAVFLYIGLYVAWTVAQTHIGTASSILGTIHEIIFTPQATVFVFMRGLILVILFYVIADLFLASARGVKRHGTKSKARTSSNSSAQTQ